MSGLGRGLLDAHSGSLFGDQKNYGDDFSRDRKYRYKLWRIWDRTKTTYNFCMLNPSSATWDRLDNTCLRTQSFVEAWGGGGLIISNCFALIDTDPSKLYDTGDPIGRRNNKAISEAAKEAGIVIAAWGNHARLGDRADAVYQLLLASGTPIQCLATTKLGEPGHPLYLASKLKPQAYIRPSASLAERVEIEIPERT